MMARVKGSVQYRRHVQNYIHTYIYIYGFGWDIVIFLHSSLYGDTFWICDESSVKNCPASHTTPAESRLGVHKELEGGRGHSLNI